MSIAIGIEGGGTKTRMLYRERNAEAVYAEEPHSIKVVKDDYARSAEMLEGLLGTLFDLSQPLRISIGLAGMQDERRQRDLTLALRKRDAFARSSIQIQSDAMLTMSAALGEREQGIVAIVGTGSVVFARSRKGVQRFGGWGPMISDGGSGQWIGLRALRHWASAYDGTRERDDLYHIVAGLLPNELREHPHLVEQHIERSPQYAARFAPTVFEVLRSSEAASTILNGAADELSGLMHAAIESIDSINSIDSVPIVLSGSVAKNPVMLALLEERLPSSQFQLLDEMAPVMRALELAEELSD